VISRDILRVYTKNKMNTSLRSYTCHNTGVNLYACECRVEYQFPDFSRYRAVISETGSVLWEPAGVFETSCKIDITFYPYDTQVTN